MNKYLLKIIAVALLLASANGHLFASDLHKKNVRTVALHPEDNIIDLGLDMGGLNLGDESFEYAHMNGWSDEVAESTTSEEYDSAEEDEEVVAEPVPLFTKLDSFKAHQDFMLKAIGGAKTSIKITAVNFNALYKDHKPLFDCLQQASARDVKISFYFKRKKAENGEKETKQSDAIFKLFKHMPKFHTIDIHTKVIMIDGNQLALGSFNWLEDKKYGAHLYNESVVVQTAQSEIFIPMVKNTLKAYKRLAKNKKGFMTEIDQQFSAMAPQVLKIGHDSQVELITTPQRHRQVFHDLFKTTQRRLVICAPFVSSTAKTLAEILPLQLVADYLKGNKILQILYTTMSDDEPVTPVKGTPGKARKKEVTMIDRLKGYLGDLIKMKNLILTHVDHLHQKTIVADYRYTIGSFNWMSSAGTVSNQYNLSEMTFVLEGGIAQPYMEDFEAKFKIVKP